MIITILVVLCAILVVEIGAVAVIVWMLFREWLWIKAVLLPWVVNQKNPPTSQPT
jgi:hypothetical protein